MKTYLVCFDIEDDRTRHRIGRELLGYGERVQRSVFEVAFNSPRDYHHVRQRLAELAGDERDIRFYHLCGNCREASATLQGDSVMYFPRTVIL